MISAVLLFSEADNNALVDFSKQINKRTDSLIKLDGHFLPHITLAQFAAPDESAEKLWQNIEYLKGGVNKLVSGGLTFAPTPQHNQLWVELQFLKSTALANLQSEILKTDFAADAELHSSGAGDNYRPHCTLALLKGQTISKLELPNVEIFKRGFSNLQLAVGLNGENFTFVDTKFS